MIDQLTNTELIAEIREMRNSFAPFLNNKGISVLKEAERRLTGGESSNLVNPKKKTLKQRKREAFTHFLLK
ncbi:hypothetical protein [Foetidibacter luteolus]|uniref:hypothetical protein n=1 Tax=Foetidibacter luteolus TaxID=2608880 RepID=UPI00129A2BD7|nr:hypothetical protein [Foetidibacter luteolus]